MDNQNRARASYSYHGEDRRQNQNVLPSISSHLHYSTNTANDPDARQSPPGSPDYAQTGTISHAPYDPVHDAYDLPPRTATSHGSEFHGAYAPDAYHRGDRSVMHTYNPARQFETTTLAPIQAHHHDRLPHPPMHEADAFRTSPPTRAPIHGIHSFQTHSQTHAGGSSSAAVPHGVTQPARVEGELAPYPTLPPLSVPSQASASSGEGKGGSKRIVMACHQCRGRKIRCDATRPACSNCVRRREQCSYDTKPKRRGPDKVPGSRMRSCKSRKQTYDDASTSGTLST